MPFTTSVQLAKVIGAKRTSARSLNGILVGTSGSIRIAHTVTRSCKTINTKTSLYVMWSVKTVAHMFQVGYTNKSDEHRVIVFCPTIPFGRMSNFS